MSLKCFSPFSVSCWLNNYRSNLIVIMNCFIVFYFVMMLFVLGMCLSEYCTFEDIYGTINPNGVFARCGKPHTMHILDFIPPISNFVLYFSMFNQKIVQLPFNAFQNVSSQYNVSNISLQRCKVQHIDANAFLNLHNLTSLRLVLNDIHYVDSKTFHHVTKLSYIYLDHNQIKLLPKGLFENLTLLEIVTLSYNQIINIEVDTFRNTPLLKVIHLGMNKIEYLDVSFKDNFLNDTILILNNNPWICDCNLIELYDLYMRLPKNSTQICENPRKIRGTRWLDLTRDKFTCAPRIEILLNEIKEVPVGWAVSLPCVVYSHDKPNIKWRKGSTIVISDYLSTSSYKDKHFLNYTFHFEENDAGVYYCSAEFADGRLEVNITLRVYNGTKYHQVDTSISQSLSIPNWIPYTILFLVLVCVAAIIIGIVFVVRHTLAKSNRRRHVRLPTIVKPMSYRRTNARNVNNTIPMREVQSRPVSENSGSESSIDEEPTPIQHYEIREATIN